MKFSKRRGAAIALMAAAVTAASMLSAPAAQAVGNGVSQSTAVNVKPSTATPNVTNGTVYAITKVGSQVILGGSFTAAQNQGSTTTVTRTDILAFDSASGTLSTTFAPTLDGTVQAVAPGPSANTVYVGGYFKTVNGAKARNLALLNTTTGAMVPGFNPPAFNGAVQSLVAAGGHLFVTGGFTLANTTTRLGFASLNPTTGALDNFATIALEGHHNYNGSGAKGALGGRAMAINPAGTRLVVLGNFKTANGLPRDQVAMLDIDGSTAQVDPWATLKFTAPCANWAFDTYVTDVQFAPDGSYFAITVTGGGMGSKNSDGTLGLCDSVSRWQSGVTSSNALPSWVDYTGNDTLWSVAVTGSAIYVGGHQRWLNNSFGSDRPAAGAVPRAGLAALDPSNGLPLAWNPGRNPRGAGAYALLVTSDGLYVGSDTDYFGNFYYKRQKIGFFPLAGGAAIAPTTTASLPSNLFMGGPTQGQAGVTNSDLAYRPISGTQIGSATAVPAAGLTWNSVRAAFVVGTTLFYGRTDGTFAKASFNGQTVGTATTVDPYNDPAWSSVNTGSGQTYRGAVPGFYAEISSVTGAFYSNGRLYYTLSGKRGLYSRYFTPDSGVVGTDEFVDNTPDLSQVSGMTASGNTLYYARSTDGTLRSMPFVNGVVDQTKEAIVSGPAQDGQDWRAFNLFLYGTATFPNTPPTASAVVTCQQQTCTFDGTGSTDSDGSVQSYSWNFGDGSTGSGATTTHGYAAAGDYTITLTVTDDRGGVSTPWTGQVTVVAPTAGVSQVGVASTNALSTAPSVTVPAATQAGDTEVLIASTATNGVVQTPSGGWTEVGRETNAPLETVVYTRTAGAGDGTTVTVPLTSSVRVDVQLAVYRGVGSTSVTTAGIKNASSQGTPAVDVSAGGSWVLSYWTVRSSSATTWSAPSAVTIRSTSNGTGGGHVDSLLGDSGAALPSGSYGPQFAGTGTPASKAATVAVVLAPSA